MVMFMDDLGALGVKFGDGKALMAKNCKICDFYKDCALSTTVRVPTAYFSFLCVLGVHGRTHREYGRAPFPILRKTIFFHHFLF